MRRRVIPPSHPLHHPTPPLLMTSTPDTTPQESNPPACLKFWQFRGREVLHCLACNPRSDLHEGTTRRSLSNKLIDALHITSCVSIRSGSDLSVPGSPCWPLRETVVPGETWAFCSERSRDAFRQALFPFDGCDILIESLKHHAALQCTRRKALRLTPKLKDRAVMGWHALRVDRVVRTWTFGARRGGQIWFSLERRLLSPCRMPRAL
jgi:hypothetical protein